MFSINFFKLLCIIHYNDGMLIVAHEKVTTKCYLFLDIVTAYKGLVKEKEALESSLKAITQNEPTTKSSKEARNLSETESERSSSSNSNSNNSNNIQREYEQNKVS